MAKVTKQKQIFIQPPTLYKQECLYNWMLFYGKQKSTETHPHKTTTLKVKRDFFFKKKTETKN